MFRGEDGDPGAGGWLVSYDGFGGIYAVGVSIGQHGYDCLVLRLDDGGNLIWSRAYDGPGGSYDQPTDCVVGPDGSIYIALMTHGLSSSDYGIIKYSILGELEYAAIVDGSAGGTDRPECIVLDKDGSVYVGGESGGDFHEEFSTLRVDPTGQVVWERRYDHPGKSFGGIRALDLVYDGGVIVAGYSGGQGKDYDIVVIKYSRRGEVEWQYVFDSGESDHAWDLIALPDGGCIVAGETEGENPEAGILTLRIDNAGHLLWADAYSGTPEGRNFLQSADFVPPCFAYGAAVSGYDLVVMRYDVGGPEVPRQFVLGQNFPNPFNDVTTVPYELISEGQLAIQVFNVLGQEISSENLGRRPAGVYQHAWSAQLPNGRNAVSGVYFVRLTMNNDSETKKMVLIK